ncbi:Meiotic coiled-coil protein 2 [Madurella mycetomatis]|uniref:Meiotic coiled-coil protein 2 n=1 Tax=Madurella mycetomatis TaxID=100816 RepID=A0A175WBZ2_9PEZI|nr:Meiotic coiled-coil protein 2 [Madurella mycetomatis]
MPVAAALTGSPNERQTASSKSFSQDENSKRSDEFAPQNSKEAAAILCLKKTVGALSTSKLANQSYPKKLKITHEPIVAAGSYPMDKLYAKLSEQHAILQQQNEARSPDDEAEYTRGLGHQSSSSPLPITPVVETFSAPTAPTTRSASVVPNESQVSSNEVLRLKLELAQAQSKISRLDQELAQTRLVNQESGRATPSLFSEPDFPSTVVPPTSPVASRVPSAATLIGLGKEPFIREHNWMAQDDTRSDIGDSLSVGGFNRSRGIWNNKIPFGNHLPQVQVMGDGSQAVPWANSRSINPNYEAKFAPPSMDMYRQDRIAPEQEVIKPIGRRGSKYDNRFGPSSNFSGVFGGYNMGAGQYELGYAAGPQGTMTGGMGMGLFPPYQQQPVGTTLSPHATEFTSTGAPWKTESLASEGQTYVSATTEPLNYRRLLDRNVTCDWKYIVDKIVCNNDQQASIFLQQKLKVGTPEQKYNIVEAIVAQAYHLMVNRFGNFLIQRCFEHGTPEQIIKIAEAIRGNTLNLSMDPFGCHVVQKAFDSVPEDYKAIMVHELLRHIPETVIHRYACHVWQKLFELRWAESPPQIMKYVNEALRGMWHEVALGETGSLVVQNIFENCLEEDKRPCIEEVLANIDIVAHGQFGNWCIQHICEHGAPADRSRAIDHVIRYAAEYSMDQFASKVVEKCLKIGGPEFLGRYLDRVCEGRVGRPRIPLIDIAGDQYGNYLIQYILTHADPQHHEIVAAHIRKHMVSLRGSKFGSRVGMLCTNHAATTRLGPGVGPAMGGRMGPSARYGGAYR